LARPRARVRDHPAACLGRTVKVQGEVHRKLIASSLRRRQQRTASRRGQARTGAASRHRVITTRSRNGAGHAPTPTERTFAPATAAGISAGALGGPTARRIGRATETPARHRQRIGGHPAQTAGQSGCSPTKSSRVVAQTVAQIATIRPADHRQNRLKPLIFTAIFVINCPSVIQLLQQDPRKAIVENNAIVRFFVSNGSNLARHGR
jgi:hypothetical protein